MKPYEENRKDFVYLKSNKRIIFWKIQQYNIMFFYKGWQTTFVKG